MKVAPECASCLIQRGYHVILRATEDERMRLATMRELLRLIARNFGPDVVPAYIGTERERLIRRMTANPDPYADIRSVSNKMALDILPLAEKFVNESSTDYERFRRLCLVSILANAIEFDVPGHSFDFESLRKTFSQEKLAVDHTRKIYDELSSSERVMFLTDNIGEIAFDVALVKGIKSLGPKVSVSVKGTPIIDDALMSDALQVGMDRVADKLITTGSDTVGLVLREASPDFIRELSRCDVLVAKGMGNYETLTEERLEKPVVFLLKAKCSPVAKSINVSKGSNVAKWV